MAHYFELTEAFYGDDWTVVEADEQPQKDYSMESVSGLLQLANANAENVAVGSDRKQMVDSLVSLARGRRREPRSFDPLTQILRRNK